MAQTQKNGLIAQRYAQSLVEIVKDGKLNYERISADLNTIQNTLNQSKDLDAFLINPLMSQEDKKEILSKIFSGEIESLMLNFLKVLIDKNRFETFKEIVESYNKILDTINKISRINVVSAVELSENSKNKLKEKLEYKLQKTVTLDWEIDPKIIAGLVIKMGDNVIDTSLKHKLEDLSKSISK